MAPAFRTVRVVQLIARLTAVFMGSPVFVNWMRLCGGALADPSREAGAEVEPIWAGPSLPAIFLDKNAGAYCGYSGLDSLVD
jgi:hypothetical protein